MRFTKIKLHNRLLDAFVVRNNFRVEGLSAYSHCNRLIFSQTMTGFNKKALKNKSVNDIINILANRPNNIATVKKEFIDNNPKNVRKDIEDR